MKPVTTTMLAIMKHISKPKSAAVIVQYGMSARRIFCAKIDVFVDLGWFGVRLSENDGVQIFPPLDPHKGAHFIFGSTQAYYVLTSASR